MILWDWNWTEKSTTANKSGLHWKSLPTRILPSEREKRAPRNKSSMESLTITRCGNSTENHKLKLAVIRKAKKS
jgi:hypothetical protein